MGDWFSSSGDGTGRFKSTLSGIVIGAMLVGLVWLIASALQQGSDRSSQTPGSSIASDSPDQTGLADIRDSSSPSPTGGTNDRPALRAAVLDACRDVYRSQVQPLRAAATAMGQWQVHIAAMNQLVLGVISLQPANQFWNQTRDGAHAHLHAFRVAAAHTRQPSALCPAPPSSVTSGSGTPSQVSASGKVVGCERAVAARFRVLRSAHVALGTWSMHVMHMEMLRRGQMTPQHAETLWLHSWHEGQKEVTAYHAAMRAARGPRC